MTPAIAAPRERLVSIFDVDACAFCDALGVMHKCGWPAEREVRIDMTELRPGDRVRVGPGHRDFRRVASVVLSHDKRTVFYWLSGLRDPHAVNISTDFRPDILGLRPAICAAACCDNCAIERADHVHICRDHWMDWSRIS